ncbi:MAG: homogentisate phytyltransferase [Chitinophagales bacterium]
MKALLTLWKFSRPHTVAGTVISIFTLYYIITAQAEDLHYIYLFLALIIGITCNIFIVGINLIADVPIDAINKPYLPIPSGALQVRHAKIIVTVSLFISLILALCITPILFGIIALAAIIGWAYSMPPFYLKKHHITSALAIASVRGVLLNAGGFLVFNYLVNDTLEMPENVLIITAFIIVFSVVISWFKDLPDIPGDTKYHIKTFAIQYSPKQTLIWGNVWIDLAYTGTIFLKAREYITSSGNNFETRVLLFGHIFLFLLFILHAFTIHLNDAASVKKYYKRFWLFFFAEYALYLLAYAGA